MLSSFGLGASPAAAQLREAPAAQETGAEEDPIVFRFRVGVEVTAKRGACKNIGAMVATPIPGPRQTVRLVDEQVSPGVREVQYRELQGGAARQMLVSIPYLENGAKERAVVTYEITTHSALPVDEDVAATYNIPRRVPSSLRRFIAPSPFIESKNAKIKRLARELIDEEATEGLTDWQRVELLYDHVLDEIDYAEGPDTSALETLTEGVADCHGRSALFIALCRAAGVPARIVWVNEHCYAEFYMEDPDGEGVWLPIESAGTRAFGEMPLVRGTEVLERVVLQRGDNFRVPERPRERLRYASDYLTGSPLPGSGKPSVKYIREVVRDETE